MPCDRVNSWSELEARLHPILTQENDHTMADDGDAIGREFEPVLCHLRRVLFWLESADLGNPVSIYQPFVGYYQVLYVCERVFC